MSALFAYITTNWVSIAAAIGALGHFFPPKTIANKVANAIVSSATPQQAVVTSVAAVVTPPVTEK